MDSVIELKYKFMHHSNFEYSENISNMKILLYN